MIYPNPTNEGVFVQSNSDEPSQITFYNAMGREVRSSIFLIVYIFQRMIFIQVLIFINYECNNAYWKN
ncbi:MAG: T9SS type A sorting domain-containing protein [Saprospiraceae bacterium]|nr:T9SS type A sorting domain-containing protein [Candidatus Defluviibacterium haderslevense]